MALQLKHAKTVAKSDGLDTTVVQPSDWNAEHTLSAASGKVLGTPTGSTTVTELPLAFDATGQAMTPPSGSTASRPATPSSGMFRFNTSTGLLEAYVNSAWGSVDTFPAGTRMLFQQTSAPVGWTKDASQNDKALRVVSGSASSGGSVAFSSAFSNQSTGATATSGTVGDTTLNINQIPPHTHSFTYQENQDVNAGGSAYPIRDMETTGYGKTLVTQSAGGGGSHTHSFSGSSHSHAINLAVAYVDVIIAVKN